MTNDRTTRCGSAAFLGITMQFSRLRVATSIPTTPKLCEFTLISRPDAPGVFTASPRRWRRRARPPHWAEQSGGLPVSRSSIWETIGMRVEPPTNSTRPVSCHVIPASRTTCTATYDEKVAKWRDEQDQVLRSMQDHLQANDAYLQSGVTLLELSNRAADLFVLQPAREKRRLLDFVVSNSTWANGELTVEFRQPFDLIAVEATKCAKEKAAGAASSDLHQNRLPR